MENLYFEILLAKDGDKIATDKIINYYKKYIYYMISRYEINDKNTCYDEVVARLLNAIQQIKL